MVDGIAVAALAGYHCCWRGYRDCVGGVVGGVALAALVTISNNK